MELSSEARRSNDTTNPGARFQLDVHPVSVRTKLGLLTVRHQAQGRKLALRLRLPAQSDPPRTFPQVGDG